MPVRSLTISALLAGALTATLALAACTSDDPDPDATPPELPALAEAWSSQAVPEATRAWPLGGDVVVASEQRVAAVDATSGSTRWSRRLPGTVCAWPDGPSTAGLLALGTLVGGRGPSRCLGVVAIDLSSGEIAWRTRLTHPVDYGRAEYDQIGAGAEVVGVVDTTFDVLTRLDAATGRRLEVTEAEDQWLGIDGARLTRILFSSTRADRRTVVVEDLDTGETLVRYDGDDASVARIAAADPLVVATEGGQGRRQLRVGELGTVVGRGPGTVVEVSDGVMVSDPTGGLFVHDLATGEEVVAVQRSGLQTFVGVHEDDAILTGWPSWLPEPERVVERIDLADGSARALGTVGNDGLLVAGNLLVTGGRTAVHAYDLTGDGVDVADFDDALPWSSDDLRPAEAFDACTAVSPATLSELGLASDERVVGSCEWGGGGRLSVTVDAKTPVGDASAADRARSEVEYAADRYREVPGIGDGAWIEDAPSGPSVTALHRNVVVTVRTDVLPGRRPARARAAAEQAAREVVAELETR